MLVRRPRSGVVGWVVDRFVVRPDVWGVSAFMCVALSFGVGVGVVSSSWLWGLLVGAVFLLGGTAFMSGCPYVFVNVRDRLCVTVPGVVVDLLGVVDGLCVRARLCGLVEVVADLGVVRSELLAVVRRGVGLDDVVGVVGRVCVATEVVVGAWEVEREGGLGVSCLESLALGAEVRAVTVQEMLPGV